MHWIPPELHALKKIQVVALTQGSIKDDNWEIRLSKALGQEENAVEQSMLGT